MNPYEANVRNVSWRMIAWGRGMTKRYRKALLVLLLASVTTAVGVSASQGGQPAIEVTALAAG